MAMSILIPSCRKKHFENWVKGALAVLLTKDGLTEFVSAEVVRHHQRLLRLVPAANIQNTCNCTINSLPPCTRSRNHSHVVPGPRQLCSRGVCNILMDAICKDHKYRSPSWKNTDPQKWCTDAFEVAKCFYPLDGYSHTTSLLETDFNGIVSVIINNLSFTTQIQENLAAEQNICTKARKVGRDIRHSPNHEMSDSDLNNYIDDLINLLCDPVCLLNDSSAQDAVTKLRLLKANDLTIEEKDITEKLSDKIKDTLSIALRDFLPKINEHCSKLQTDSVAEIDRVADEIIRLATQIKQVIEKEMKEKKEFEEKPEDPVPGKDNPFPSLEEARRELSKFPYDGRLRTPSAKIFESIIRGLKPIRSGGYGEVYLLKDSAHEFGIEVVVKKIKYNNKETDSKKNSISCEKLASRTIHFAIVPLLALAENISAGEAYFLSPYLRNGDLEAWIQRDTAAIETDKKAELSSNIRLTILYHVTAALEFLHMEISGLRGSILHMDLASKNIVLDENLNARLIDFGLAREINEGSDKTNNTTSKMHGTPGYKQTDNLDTLTKADDWHNFGVVIREVLTGRPPALKTMLRTMKKGLVKDLYQEKIWQDKSLVNNLIDLSEKCITKEKNLEVNNEIQNLLGERKKWTPNAQQQSCEMCMLNTAATNESKEFLKHDLNCMSKINVCSACMRNSYLNPIICHSCHKELVPFIGAGWGALLIAGNDKNEALARGFKKDILNVKRVIVSRCLLVMGLSEANVEVIVPNEPGVEEDMMSKFESAVKNLKEKDIHTLLIYFSGHHFRDDGFMLGKTGQHFTVKRLQKEMREIAMNCSSVAESNLPPLFSKKRFIVFLDCCEAPDLTVNFNRLETAGSGADEAESNIESNDDKPKEGNILDQNYCVLQLNACRPSETTSGTEQGSAFTDLFIKCFTQRALDTPCPIDCKHSKLTSDFIRFDDLHRYISEHGVKLQICPPVKHEKSTLSADCVIGYNINFEVVLKFRIHDQNIDVKPDRFKDLQDLQLLLLKRIVDEKKKDLLFKGNADIIEFADCFCFETENGPKKKTELDTLDRLMSAWNSKREITISLRTSKYIDRGRVLVYSDIEETKKVKAFFKEYYITETETYVIPLKQVRRKLKELNQKMPDFAKELEDLVTCLQSLEVQEGIMLHILFPKSSEQDKAGTSMCLEVRRLNKKT